MQRERKTPVEKGERLFLLSTIDVSHADRAEYVTARSAAAPVGVEI